MARKDKNRTRSGHLRVSNDERRSWQRASRRSYNRKDSGSNQFAIAQAKRNGTYGQSPETRFAKSLQRKQVERPAPPQCQHCGSSDVFVDYAEARRLHIQPTVGWTLLCKSCQGDVNAALNAVARQ